MKEAPSAPVVHVELHTDDRQSAELLYAQLCGWRTERIQVARIDHATERTRDLGAAVLLGQREGPAGWRSVVETGTGAQLASCGSKRWSSLAMPERESTGRAGGFRTGAITERKLTIGAPRMYPGAKVPAIHKKFTHRVSAQTRIACVVGRAPQLSSISAVKGREQLN